MCRRYIHGRKLLCRYSGLVVLVFFYYFTPARTYRVSHACALPTHYRFWIFVARVVWHERASRS